MMTNNRVGLYIHVPFCRSKCPYCDFYSHPADEETKESYVGALLKTINTFRKEFALSFRTVYIGGGTPSQLGSSLLGRLVSGISFETGAEITVECNPSDVAAGSEDDAKRLAQSGVNRISMGLQSAVDDERRSLGRRAGIRECETALGYFRKAGIDNISLDLMLGIPGQTLESARESVRFIADSGAVHASAYLLSIEEGTPFGKVEDTLDLPDEDLTSEIYLSVCEGLEKAGLRQYEISNFAVPGLESRHNLIYWNDEEYLGVGPAAHSFINGKRFFYPRSTDAFMSGEAPVPDGDGGSFEEYAMLRLRLTEGLTHNGVKMRFGHTIPESMIRKAEKYQALGKIDITDKGFSFTPHGFLVSNPIIAELLSP